MKIAKKLKTVYEEQANEKIEKHRQKIESAESIPSYLPLATVTQLNLHRAHTLTYFDNFFLSTK